MDNEHFDPRPGCLKSAIAGLQEREMTRAEQQRGKADAEQQRQARIAAIAKGTAP